MLRHALAKSGVPFSPHNPAHTHHYAKSTRRRAKTDRLDAANLAARSGSKNWPSSPLQGSSWSSSMPSFETKTAFA
ncbi:MAG: hypothetical protein EOR88_25065 [Mesorhizobium sp.]|nr:hypothetical protein EOA49_22820 [Mesorhizobium sp. M1A.F.Ca.IN.020.04.1.1]RUW10904.1 hypothetical protein EOA53_13640 [Mesorhizobium sp. M1A.F.Ca.IN.020.03.1.1]RWF72125.1 MAG: hypothetical protein EOQ34_13095 [Mesorhizobium sp.]RWG15090.1 MAG: hypothetical protein EOQ58_12795 [Mesorhizobium sp.]RWG28253.1 MAG: hypothetical protein EOQ61_21640 [Mesorhizobium sp.]